MKRSKISASMMCCNLLDLKQTIKIAEEEKIDFLHIDVMDGNFVPNFGLGVDYIRGLRELTDIPLDIHLMIKNPEYKLQWLGLKPSDTVSIHSESTFQVQRALDCLHTYGCHSFLAISPATPINSLEEVLDDIEGINLLMVNPGFAGQKMVASTLKKAAKLKKFLDENEKSDLDIEVDGNITLENGKKLKKLGANIFVAGTSSIFSGEVQEYRQRIRDFREAIE